MADQNGIPGATEVIGLDFGLGTPGEKSFDTDVHLFDSDGIGRVPDALVHTGAEFRITVRKIARTRGLQPGILGFGDEEGVRDGLHLRVRPR